MNKMSEEEKFTPAPPSFKGDGVAIWKATDKNNNLYLKVKILGMKNAVNCFKYEPKPKKEDL